MLTDDFNDGNFAGWTVVDEGTVKAPSNWNAATGELVQASNIHDGDTDPATLPKLGTLAWYDNGLAWSNYQVGLTLRSQDQDALGVIFRYQDPNNYYRFSWDRWRAYRRLVKVENGVFTLLAEDSVLYTVGQTYAVDIQANGDTIDVSIDGVQVFAVTDSGTTLTTGSIGLYSWGNNGGFYDNIQVDSVSPPPPPQTLTVSLTGNGTVTSSPGGIACPGDCTEDFPGGQSVTLTATPAAGSIFLGWSGDCPGTGNCVVSMTQARAVTATFDIASSTTLPFSDSFDDGNFTGWTVVDEGTNADPSAWSATTGALVQSSNIYGGSTDGSLLPKPGTFLFYSGGSTWTDYQATFTMSSTDNDALGVMVRYQDPDNYYRFSWDSQRQYRRLVKVENGVFTLLAEDSVAYTVGQTYAVDILANGDSVQVWIDGVQVFAVTDSGTTLTTGSIGLYSWGNNGSYFDNLVVDDSVSPPPPLQTLTVSLTGDGTVTSSPTGITCPGNCTENYPSGQSVTLTATPASGSVFLGWSGDCPGTGSCIVSMTQARAVTASFDTSTTTLLSDNFDDGNFTSWTVVDEGTVKAPSNWGAATGELVQASNIHDGDTNPATLPKRGTFAWYDNGLAWSNYQVGLTLRSQDQDALGVIFRYQDPNNYYRFSWDRWRAYRRLVKVENGVFSLLAEDSVVYTVGHTYAVDIQANGDTIEVSIDGVQVFAVTDSGTTLTTGSIGLYSWGNNGSYFDDIQVSEKILHILSPQELDVITTTIAPIPPTIEVTVQTAAIGIPSNWGVEFVVDGDDLNAVQDYTSPFELVTNLVPAEHTVTSYLIDEVGVRQTNSFDEVNFGVGDSYVAFGDSITFGANHDNVTQDDVSADGRNSGGGYEPILNDLLTDAKNYPHSVENEGISGDETIDGVMRITDVLAARPNSNYYLIMFGTNDSFLPVPSGMGLTSNDPGYPGTYKDNMQQIITAILQEGKTPLLAKVPIRYGDCGSGCNPFPNPSAAPGNLLIQEYNIVVDELVISNGVEDPSGNSLTPPDLYTYFEGTQVVNGKSVEFDDFLHPNGVGLQSMANLWLQSLAP